MPLIATFVVPHPPLIVPAVGKGEEKGIQNTIDAYREVAKRIARWQPDAIVVTTPHAILYADYFHISPGAGAEGSFQAFGAPRETQAVRYDLALAESIGACASAMGIPAGGRGEKQKTLDHGTMVPLHFIEREYAAFGLVRIGISGLSPLIHYRFGKCVAEAVRRSGKRVVLVASGDLSHKLKADGPYGFAPEGPAFDRDVTAALRTADFERLLAIDEDFGEAAGECGLRSFLIMAGALDGKAVKPELLSYEGPFGVGYAVAAYEVLGDDSTRCFDARFEQSETARVEALKANEDPFVALARRSLEQYVRTRRRLARPAGLPAELAENRAGVFVSLKMDGRLRGCIGTIAPTAACIADEIVQNAVSAGTADSRFDPVREAELTRLVYSVDVLGQAEPIRSKAELDVTRYGVIVRLRGRCGLLLPHLEGVDTPDEQVRIALQKGGIAPNEPYTMERFEVIRHH